MISSLKEAVIDSDVRIYIKRGTDEAGAGD